MNISQGTHEVLDGLYIGLPVGCPFANVDRDRLNAWIRVVAKHDAEQQSVRDQQRHSRKVAYTR